MARAQPRYLTEKWTEPWPPSNGLAMEHDCQLKLRSAVQRNPSFYSPAPRISELQELEITWLVPYERLPGKCQPAQSAPGRFCLMVPAASPSIWVPCLFAWIEWQSQQRLCLYVCLTRTECRKQRRGENPPTRACWILISRTR